MVIGSINYEGETHVVGIKELYEKAIDEARAMDEQSKARKAKEPQQNSKEPGPVG